MRRPPSLVLAFEELNSDGGIASVSRCVTRVFDGEVNAGRIARADRVVLHDDPAAPPPPPARGSQFCEGGSKPRFVWHLCRLGIAHRPDLVVFDHLGVARSAVLPLPGIPRRYTVFVHGIELEALKPGNLFDRALRGASAILTNSAFTAKWVERVVPEVGARTRPLHLCVEPARVETWRAIDRERARSEREAAVLIVARMAAVEQGKGHDHLLGAWPSIVRRVPHARLWICGGGDDRPRLEALARELGISGSVDFLGRIDDAELADRYRRARVFAMPSRQEGFGLVYAEAMWHGLPCVGSTADAAAEVIVDGETGRLVPYGDSDALANALAGLLLDPGRAAQMGEAARRRVLEHYSYPHFRRDLLEALDLA